MSAPLNSREVDVLKLLSEGFTRDEAAARMGSTKVIVDHVAERLKKKLRAKNMVHAVAIWIRGGASS